MDVSLNLMNTAKEWEKYLRFFFLNHSVAALVLSSVNQSFKRTPKFTTFTCSPSYSQNFCSTCRGKYRRRKTAA